jgi:hypothetical protein
MKIAVLFCVVAFYIVGCDQSFKPLGPLAQQIEAKYGTPTLSLEEKTLRIQIKSDDFDLQALQNTSVNLQETDAYRFAFEVAAFAKLHYEDSQKLKNYIVVLDQRIDAIQRFDFEFTFSAASLN